MAIRIKKGRELRREALTVIITGQPNAGKTTLGLTARNPVLLDFDAGSIRAIPEVRGDRDVVERPRLSEIRPAEDFAGYDSVVVDTLGAMTSAIEAEITAEGESAMVQRTGMLTMRGYGELGRRAVKFLSAIRAAGKHLILIVHVAEKNQGDATVERIIVAGSVTRNYAHQAADLMGRICVDPETDSRYITFELSRSAYAKNVGLPDYTLHPESDDTLAEIIDIALARMNMAAGAAA